MITLTEEIPPEMSAWAEDQHRFLASDAWADVLRQGLGARILRAWDSDRSRGCLLPIFSRGPLRVGYLGFPALVGSLDADDVTAVLRKAESLSICHVLRIPISVLCTLETDAGLRLPETVIDDLQSWRPESDAALRRAIRRARKKPVSVRPASEPRDAQRCFELYSETIRRHRGSMRYTPRYFDALVRTAVSDHRLTVLVALHDGEIVGFLVWAREGASGLYLHGGVHAPARSLCVMDRLFDAMLLEAKAAGLSAFSFLPSPADQPSLVRYKEKWGGHTRPMAVRQAAFGFVGRLLGRVLRAR